MLLEGDGRTRLLAVVVAGTTKKRRGPWDIFKDDVLPRLRFSHVYGDVTFAKQKGDKHRGACPIHGGKNPESFSVDGTKLIWKCHSACDKGGGPVEFLVEMLGITKEEARDDLAKRVGVDLAYMAKTTPLNAKALKAAWSAWCGTRKLNPEKLIATIGGTLKAYGRPSRPAVMFPVDSGGRRVRFLDEGKPKIRWTNGGSPDNYSQWYSLKLALKLLKDNGTLYVVNGEPAVWACLQSGIPAVNTAGEGAVPAPRLIRKLREVLEEREADVRIIYDRDKPGRTGAWRLVDALTGAGISAVALETPASIGEKDDVEDLHRVTGDAGLGGALSAFIDLPPLLADLVQDSLPGAPVPGGSVVPPGWRVTHLGLGKVKHDKVGDETVEIVTQAPILMASRLVDVNDGTESVELVWPRGKIWNKRVVDRLQMMDRRKIVDLAQHGAPVSSEHSGKVVTFLDQFEGLNLSRLPCSHVSRQMGWQGKDGALGFLVGDQLIRPEGKTGEHITFFTPDSGERQLADGFAPSGNMEGWLDAISQLHRYPRVLLAIYASLTAPMLSIIGAPNFIVDWSFMTSRGKTTTLRVGASCWGATDERSTDTALFTWFATKVWIERASAALNCIPIILDDTKLKSDRPKDIATIAYMAANGRGRGRGSPSGMRRSGSWTTVMLSSGEQPITSFTQDGGTLGRVITIWGQPFGASNETTARVVHKLNASMKMHYGHAGPAFVKYLQEHRSEWANYRSMFLDAESKYIAHAEGNPVAVRLMTYLAAISVTAHLAHKAIDFPFDNVDVIAQLWEIIVAECRESDRPTSAMDTLINWATSNTAMFLDKDPKKDPPVQGWAGRWWRDDSKIAFYQHKLLDVLKDSGHDPQSTLRAWKENGWLIVEKGKKLRLTKAIRIRQFGSSSAVVRCYVIDYAAVRKDFGLDKEIKDDDKGKRIGTEQAWSDPTRI